MPLPECIDNLRRLVGENPSFQRRVWVMQRIGWALMGALVLLGLAGGLGGGPLSTAEAVSPDGALRVRHDAVARQDSATRWRIALPPGSSRVTIASEALSWLEVVNIQPAPARQTHDGRALTLQFDDARLATLTVEPLLPGRAEVTIAAGHARAAFRMLVLP
ncbi:hypothetical protein AAFN86_03515 [Roseomonas sp. CAU 1739]|uniref:hypothetical protein n=1 Tax=Roseomonas sp. CAU 1739 TaxID=3140364 RepID=UPI00325C2EBC